MDRSLFIKRCIPLCVLFAVFVSRRTQALDETQAFDHTRWDKVLKAAVTEDGWVDYGAIRRRLGSELQGYLRQLAAAKLESLTTASERMAFWINSYNAICIQKLIDHGVPAEVPHAVFFGKNIFSEKTYEVAGKIRSLDEIEHRILRAKFKDNRVHAALVCGASSCPRLRPEAYSGKDLNHQLDDECRRWVGKGEDKNGQRKNYLDRQQKTIHVSKIFDWFQEDFDGSTEGVLKFIRRYATESDRAFLEKNRVRVRYLDYDWAVNSQG